MYRIPAVYQPDNYHGRVKLAASYIAQDKGGTRSFDTCFEMDDGAAVAVALYRRAQENPNGPLAKNLWTHISKDYTLRSVERFKHVATKDLPSLARELRDAHGNEDAICDYEQQSLFAA
jgi:hypothetical protein